MSSFYQENKVTIDDIVINERPDIETGRIKLEDTLSWGFEKGINSKM